MTLRCGACGSSRMMYVYMFVVGDSLEGHPRYIKLLACLDDRPFVCYAIVMSKDKNVYFRRGVLGIGFSTCMLYLYLSACQ